MKIALTLMLMMLPFTAAAGECMDCHRSLDFNESNPRLFYYFNDFSNSVHGVAGLVCSDCHDGDPDERDLDKAHVGVMDPVRFDNIVATCGRCHAAVRDGFTASEHHRLLTTYQNAPNCVTCHGSMEVEVVNPGRIQTACAFCHNPESLTSPDIPERACEILIRIDSIKSLKIEVEARATDGSLVWDLARDYRSMAARWHAFDLQGMEDDTRKLKSEYLEARRMMEFDPDY
jgi:hypothetical protein